MSPNIPLVISRHRGVERFHLWVDKFPRDQRPELIATYHQIRDNIITFDGAILPYDVPGSSYQEQMIVFMIAVEYNHMDLAVEIWTNIDIVHREGIVMFISLMTRVELITLFNLAVDNNNDELAVEIWESLESIAALDQQDNLRWLHLFHDLPEIFFYRCVLAAYNHPGGSNRHSMSYDILLANWMHVHGVHEEVVYHRIAEYSLVPGDHTTSALIWCSCYKATLTGKNLAQLDDLIKELNVPDRTNYETWCIRQVNLQRRKLCFGCLTEEELLEMPCRGFRNELERRWSIEIASMNMSELQVFMSEHPEKAVFIRYHLARMRTHDFIVGNCYACGAGVCGPVIDDPERSLSERISCEQCDIPCTIVRRRDCSDCVDCRVRVGKASDPHCRTCGSCPCGGLDTKCPIYTCFQDMLANE
jgi:hypothetical protein